MRKLILCLFISLTVCLGAEQIEEIIVTRCILPQYPDPLSADRVQGIVRVRAEIGKDGKVISAIGTMDSDQPLDKRQRRLVRTAEENLREWTFYFYPHSKNFPKIHTVEYIFKVEGQPTIFPKPRYHVHLPDRVEMITEPYQPNIPELVELEDPSNKKRDSSKKKRRKRK